MDGSGENSSACREESAVRESCQSDQEAASV